MRLWAIGDLHLPGGDKKPMDIFGAHWKNHFERISEDWRSKVAAEDVVLIPGDISWAITLDNALEDLKRIAQLPGTIGILKGNHDFWWNSLTQLRMRLPSNMFALQNDAFRFGNVIIAGTRGWTIPTGAQADEKVIKIYKREIQRLSFSLDRARELAGPDRCTTVVMMHYPPITQETLRTGTGFTEVLRDAGIRECIYGHLHGNSIGYAVQGVVDGVRYDLVSCDALGFELMEVPIPADQPEQD
ncbi:MAG: metallophosphoesterase [Clostridia bacterium]|nr:metallophosphoesterase [Clostridia bacterium]